MRPFFMPNHMQALVQYKPNHKQTIIQQPVAQTLLN